MPGGMAWQWYWEDFMPQIGSWFYAVSGILSFTDIHFAVMVVKKNISLLPKIHLLVFTLSLINCWAFWNWMWGGVVGRVCNICWMPCAEIIYKCRQSLKHYFPPFSHHGAPRTLSCLFNTLRLTNEVALSWKQWAWDFSLSRSCPSALVN